MAKKRIFGGTEKNENILKIELEHKSCLDLAAKRKSKKVITKLGPSPEVELGMSGISN